MRYVAFLVVHVTRSHAAHRYLVCIQDDSKNPYRTEVVEDIVDALLKVKAANGVPAVYRPQEEQEERMIEVYNKWEERGNVWTMAAAKVRPTRSYRSIFMLTLPDALQVHAK